jgi:hypothetical protein
MTTTCSIGQPRATARWRSAYWRWVLLRLELRRVDSVSPDGSYFRGLGTC